MPDSSPFSTYAMGERPLAAITGAASGIGAAFARTLAKRGYDLLLVDLQAEAAEKLASSLTHEFSAKIQVLQADLALSSDCQRVQSAIEQLPRLDLLINNAGFGTTRSFASANLQRQLDMVHVHALASMRFCRAALPGMIARNSGSIINLCSIAAFTRFPESASYSASKAFLLVFSECLISELAATAVKVQALCPGQTYTQFSNSADMTGFDASRIPKLLWSTPETVVEKSLKALDRGPGRFIPSFKNRIYVLVFGSQLVIPLMTLLRRFGVLERIVHLLRWLKLSSPEGK